MPSVIITIYFILILIFLAFGAAVVFHLLYYKINRHVSGMMTLIYIVGAALLLISNFILFTQVDWNQLFGNIKL
jgi:hypothetical protein